MLSQEPPPQAPANKHIIKVRTICLQGRRSLKTPRNQTAVPRTSQQSWGCLSQSDAVFIVFLCPCKEPAPGPRPPPPEFRPWSSLARHHGEGTKQVGQNKARIPPVAGPEGQTEGEPETSPCHLPLRGLNQEPLQLLTLGTPGKSWGGEIRTGHSVLWENWQNRSSDS